MEGTRTARVYWDAPTDEHPGYVAEVEPVRWNGFAVPRFTEEVARQIVADMAAQNAAMTDASDQDVLEIVSETPLVIHHRTPTYADGEDDLYEVITAGPDGLFAVGGWCWTWMEVDE